MKGKPVRATERKLTAPRTRGNIDWADAFLKALEESGVIAAADTEEQLRPAPLIRVSLVTPFGDLKSRL